MAEMASEKKVDIGLHDKFLTEDNLLEYRFLTTMLEVTNIIDEPSSGETNIYPNTHPSYNIYRVTADLTDLLVRHHEVVAVTSTDAKGKQLQGLELQEPDLEDQPSDHEEQEETGVIFAANPRKDDQRGNAPPPSKLQAEGKQCSPLETSLGLPPALDIGDSAAAWLLSRTEDTVKNEEWPKTDVSFGEHAATTIELIKSTHRVKTEDQDGYFKEMDKLIGYVLASSCAKIQRRILRGTDTRNLFRYTSVTEAQLRHTLKDTGLSFIKEPIQLTTHQTEAVRYIIQAMEQKKIVVATSGVSIWAQALNDKKPLFYDDKNGISQIQTLLSFVLKGLQFSFTNLVTIKKQAQLEKRDPRTQAKPAHIRQNLLETSVQQLDKAISTASRWMDLLTVLKGSLRTCLKINLKAIRVAYGLKNTIKAKTDPEELMDPTTLVSESSRLSDAMDADSSSLTSEFERTRLDDAGKREFEEIDEIAEQARWEDAAMKWLDLITLHHVALRHLARKQYPSSKDIEFSRIILDVTFEEVKLKSTLKDNLNPLRRYFDEFELLKRDPHNNNPDDSAKYNTDTSGNETNPLSDKEIEEHQRDNITAWLKEQRGFPPKWKAMTAGFKGTFHCETTIMSLYLLAQERAELVDKTVDSNDPENKYSHLRLPPASVTDKFKKTLLVLPVSKRCCPPCSALIAFIKEKYHIDILFPGSHVAWSQSALPPYLRKDAGLRVIETARKKLQERFKVIDELMQESILDYNRPRSDSADTSHIHSDVVGAAFHGRGFSDFDEAPGTNRIEDQKSTKPTPPTAEPSTGPPVPPPASATPPSPDPASQPGTGPQSGKAAQLGGTTQTGSSSQAESKAEKHKRDFSGAQPTTKKTKDQEDDDDNPDTPGASGTSGPMDMP